MMAVTVLDHLEKQPYRGTDSDQSARVKLEVGGHTHRLGKTFAIIIESMGSGTGVSWSVSSTVFLIVTERHATSRSTTNISPWLDRSFTSLVPEHVNHTSFNAAAAREEMTEESTHGRNIRARTPEFSIPTIHAEEEITQQSH